MPRTTTTTWPELAFSGWMLAAEMSMVIWLRTMRMMAGGPLAEREAGRMVSEKVLAGMTLWPSLMASGATSSVEEATAATLKHYAKPVRANRRRLSRSA